MSSTTDTFVASPSTTASWQAWVPFAGRIVFALPYAVFGLFHFVGADAMAGMVPVPGGVFWVYLTGVAMLAAAVSIATGKLDKVSSPLLALLLATFAVTLHLPMAGDPEMGQQATLSFLKDMSLAGGALLAWANALRS